MDLHLTVQLIVTFSLEMVRKDGRLLREHTNLVLQILIETGVPGNIGRIVN